MSNKQTYNLISTEATAFLTVFVGFLHLSRKMLESCLKVDYDRFLPYPFQFIIYYHQINRRRVLWTIQGAAKQTTVFLNTVHRPAVWTQHRICLRSLLHVVHWLGKPPSRFSRYLSTVLPSPYPRYSPVPTYGTPQSLPTVLPSTSPQYSPVPTHGTPQYLPTVLPSPYPQYSLVPTHGTPQYLPTVFPSTYQRYSPDPTHGTPQHLPTELPSPYPRYSPLPPHSNPHGASPRSLLTVPSHDASPRLLPIVPPLGTSPVHLRTISHPLSWGWKQKKLLKRCVLFWYIHTKLHGVTPLKTVILYRPETSNKWHTAQFFIGLISVQSLSASSTWMVPEVSVLHGCTNSGASSPGWLKFIEWCLMLGGPQHGTCCIQASNIFWWLPDFLENICTSTVCCALKSPRGAVTLSQPNSVRILTLCFSRNQVLAFNWIN